MKARADGPAPDALAAELARARALLSRVLGAELGAGAEEAAAAELEAAARRFDPRRDVVVLAERGGAPVGALLVTHEARLGPTGLVAYWAVEAPGRGRGVGRELLERAVDESRRRRLPALLVRCLPLHPAAPRLLWAHGFRVTGLEGVLVGERVRELILFERRLGPDPGPA